MADKDVRKGKDEADEEGGEAATPAKSGVKNMLLLAAGAILLVTLSVGGTLLVAKPHADPEAVDETADATDAPAPDPAADKKAAKEKKKKKGKKGQEKDKGKEGEKEAGAVTYLALDPPFVVNIAEANNMRFLQVSMEVMAKDPAVVEDVKKHMPAIRNSLVLLLSSQGYPTLNSQEGKEKIRVNSLAEIQKILQEHTGKPGVEAVYFTGFVMQ